MNIVELTNKIKQIALAQLPIKSALDGDVYENWNSGEIKYGSFNMGLQNIEYDGNIVHYTILFYYGDRLMQNKANVNAIWNDGVVALQSIVNELDSESNIYFDETVNYIPFQQKFADYLAGVYCTLNISCESELGFCSIQDMDTGVTPTYTVNFYDWDMTLLSTQQVEQGSDATAPTNPSREGYTFTGWNKSFTNIQEDTDVTAEYEINVYTVEFIDWNGDILSSQSVEYGHAATAPENPSRTGYDFIGWDKDFDNIVEDTVVIAQYQIEVFIVQFLDWNSTVISLQEVEYGHAATAPTNPSREGYTFTGWDKSFDNIVDDTVVTAEYQINYYTVQFLDWDSSLLKQEQVQYGGNATPPQNPQRQGYDFIGWSGSYTNITADTTCVAQYVVESEYVTFTSDGNSTLGLKKLASHQTLQYSRDNENWIEMTTATTLSVSDGEHIYVRGMLTSANTSSDYTQFSGSGNGTFDLKGKIGALWNYENPDAPLKPYCGYHMFDSYYPNDACRIRKAKELIFPDTTAPYCYAYMFYNSNILVNDYADYQTITLPANIVADSAYEGMFWGCNHMQIPALIYGRTIGDSGCKYMFRYCTSLTLYPPINGVNLGSFACAYMFDGCTSLQNVRQDDTLPATTLAESCYEGMFAGCTNLTTAPILPATTLADRCYRWMFSQCYNLNYVECLATDISATLCTNQWLANVTSTGTFVKAKNMSDWTTGMDGIPEDWTVEDAGGDDRLALVALQNSNVSIQKSKPSSYSLVQYSLDDGTTWQDLTTSVVGLNNGDKMLLRGKCVGNSSTTKWLNFNITGNVAVKGNINYLFDYETPDATALTYTHCGYKLFNQCAITDASELILPATTLTTNCYRQMFNSCTSLVTAPTILPATTLAERCYQNMFYGCTALTTVPELPATELAINCYQNMFIGCTSLTTAPELPASTLVSNCYYYMFQGCTSLNYIKCLATNISESNCTKNWVSNVSSTGTFVKDSTANWSTGDNGIPSGWTVQDAN